MPPAPYTKKFLCLANSRKPGGHCIAGKIIGAQNVYAGWIRPVSTRITHEISDGELQYADATYAQALDVINVTFTEHQPHIHQRENHVIANVRWEKQHEAGWDWVVNATDTHTGPLWHDGVSSFHGLNDKVSSETCQALSESLLLVQPETLTLVVAHESKYLGGSDRRVRAEFTLNNTSYNFVVTDPWVETKYFAMADGRYCVPESRICLSLPEILNGNATKLVAAVFTPENVLERRQ